MRKRLTYSIVSIHIKTLITIQSKITLIICTNPGNTMGGLRNNFDVRQSGYPGADAREHRAGFGLE